MQYIPMRRLLALVLGASLGVAAHAASSSHEHEQETVQGGHGAHVHGIAQLQIVLEGTQLDIALFSPAANLVGFEHRPETDEQKAMVALTHQRLSEGKSLFQTEPANCQLAEQEVDSSSMREPHHDHGDNAHHDDHDQHNSSHREISAHYRFTCAEPNALRAISTTLLAQFPGIHSLQVQWIIEDRQGAATLDNDRHRVIFR